MIGQWKLLYRLSTFQPLQETYKTLMVFALFPIQRVRFRRGYSRLCDAPRASIPDQRVGTYARCRLRGHFAHSVLHEIDSGVSISIHHIAAL